MNGCKAATLFLGVVFGAVATTVASGLAEAQDNRGLSSARPDLSGQSRNRLNEFLGKYQLGSIAPHIFKRTFKHNFNMESEPFKYYATQSYMPARHTNGSQSEEAANWSFEAGAVLYRSTFGPLNLRFDATASLLGPLTVYHIDHSLKSQQETQPFLGARTALEVGRLFDLRRDAIELFAGWEKGIVDTHMFVTDAATGKPPRELRGVGKLTNTDMTKLGICFNTIGMRLCGSYFTTHWEVNGRSNIDYELGVSPLSVAGSNAHRGWAVSFGMTF